MLNGVCSILPWVNANLSPSNEALWKSYGRLTSVGRGYVVPQPSLEPIFSTLYLPARPPSYFHGPRVRISHPPVHGDDRVSFETGALANLQQQALQRRRRNQELQ